MQDAHQRARRHSPLAMLWLALAFFAWLTGSFPGDPFPVSMDSSGSQWLVDVPGEPGPGLRDRSRPGPGAGGAGPGECGRVQPPRPHAGALRLFSGTAPGAHPWPESPPLHPFY